ncbi:chemotaxis protein CheW [Aliikangiella coralliicola]|uniref:Chemotaxis protein CheW n=1 Tax=Aliikangiella coralliicola TaxID=2592383 RepID=A0A545UHZ0_9GAMM|nr:chemotaxis protein CheW [Aliikangiella coralliicola]TQV89069.1 chemotaxis protein CheW [Aliikangiella coralliicola]
MSNEEKKTKAWLLQYSPEQYVAIGVHAIQELLYHSELTPLPFTPDYCRHLFRWNQMVVPVMNLNLLINEEALPCEELVVVSFQYQQQLHFGGLSLPYKPELITVNDNQYCELPDKEKFWSRIALSCFSYENSAVPILDLATLFLTANIKQSMTLLN